MNARTTKKQLKAAKLYHCPKGEEHRIKFDGNKPYMIRGGFYCQLVLLCNLITD